ncbi:MAG TPA: nitrogen fixation protein NifM, partial [Motiliproteus sp.]
MSNKTTNKTALNAAVVSASINVHLNAAAVQAYYSLRAAQRHFGQLPAELSPEQLQWLQGTVARQQQLEAQVLSTPQAAQVVVTDPMLKQALDQVQGQYEDVDAFLDDLEQVGLSVSQLSDLLERQLRVDLVLERQSATVQPTTLEEAEHYYHTHPQQFHKPERRATWHLLVTLNDDYPENSHPRVVARLEAIRQQSQGNLAAFQQQARRYSECPSALSAGELGWIPAGHLFPAIDAALFQLQAGEISPVVETDVGLHLVFCEAIEPAGAVPFAEVADDLCRKLTERKQHQ